MAGNEPTQCNGCGNYFSRDDLIPVVSKERKALHLCEACYQNTGIFAEKVNKEKRWGVKMFRAGDYKAAGTFEEAVAEFLNEHDVKEIKFAGGLTAIPNIAPKGIVDGGGVMGEVQIVPIESIWILVIYRE